MNETANARVSRAREGHYEGQKAHADPLPHVMRDALMVRLEAAGFGADDATAAMTAVGVALGPEIARLRAIEAAAIEVLASGQARYDAEEVHTGDLVPATTMQALRDAVDGQPGTASIPPAALDYAERLGLALLLSEAAELLDPDAADDARRDCARRLIETADEAEAGEAPQAWSPVPPTERGWHRRWVVIRRKGRDPRPRIAMVKNEPPAGLRVSIQGYPTLFAEDVLVYGPRVPCASVPSGWREALAAQKDVRDG